MLKRKRGQHDSGKTDPAKEVEAKIVHGKKLLNKALKLAKNFERQKMAKRIKLAQKEDPTKVERLQKEAEALKVCIFPRGHENPYQGAMLRLPVVESGYHNSGEHAPSQNTTKDENNRRVQPTTILCLFRYQKTRRNGRRRACCQ